LLKEKSIFLQPSMRYIVNKSRRHIAKVYTFERSEKIMFGEFPRQNDASAQEAQWEGWTPPWMQGEGRGPFGPGRGFGGPGHGWGHHHGWRGHRGPFGFGFGFGFGPGRHWGIPDEFLALRTEAMEVARLFAIASRGAFENKERLAQLHSFLERSHKELTEMIYGSSQEQASNTGEGAGGSSDIGQA
jgi:hypothetical protein